MRTNLGLILPLLFILAACGQQPAKVAATETNPYFQRDSNFLPVAAGGNVQITLGAMDQDQQLLTIKADINHQQNEKVFNLPVAKTIDTAELYKFVWDTATSCYIAVMKKNMEPRYYHASIQDGYLKILQVGTAPVRISDYAERLFAADSIGRKMVKSFRRRVKSGQLMEDLVVETKSLQPDSIVMNVTYGAVSKSETMAVPHFLNAGVLPTDQPDEVDYGVLQDGRFVVLYNIKLNAGELRLKQINKFSGVSATSRTEPVQSK
ncbi:hypothetical protein [Chitinophaga costaii]|nr:hypothetical protein [Chitinophaga costaii]